jgi:hypothetical protein
MPERHGITYPALVLAVPAEHLPVDLSGTPTAAFGGGRRWVAIDQQSGGLACLHPRFVASVLEVRTERLAGIRDLVAKYEGSNLGVLQPPALDEVFDYRKAVRGNLGGPVDCAVTYPNLLEAIYPIDPTPETLSWLATDDLPADLDELCPRNPGARVGLWLRAWRLYVLSQNSD